jgi:predicted nucleic acid-binding protein
LAGVATPASVFITTVTEAELRYGVALRSAGKRREAIAVQVAGIIEADF